MDPALDPDRFAAVQRVFAAVFGLSGPEREARLAALCADDAGLRALVEGLLADSAAPHALLDPLDDPPDDPPDDDATVSLEGVVRNVGRPERVDGYLVLDVLGHGGMGVVYRALQQRPRREVALKMLQPGWVQPATIERFVREAEVLGALDHPGIARVFGAGQVDLGFGEVPYLAMELVPGERLDRYAEARHLDVRARCELILAVCAAVQHAHERGVVHRDLKPGNVLAFDLDGRPAVKVLDFGIAHVSADAATLAGRTLTGQMFGTLPYMSPEQVAGNATAVDGRSDVYALGVMLFELLTGRLPIPVADLPVTEAARRIRDTDPPRLDRLRPDLARDLATIVERALVKRADDRYPSAAALAGDLRRWLDDRPILARPTSMLHRARLFTRRHRALVAGAVTTMLTLLAGLVGMTAFADRERDARLELRTAMYSMQMRALGDLLAAPRSAEAIAQLVAAWPDPRGGEPELRGFEFDLALALDGHARRSRLDAPLAEILTWTGGQLGVQTPRGVRLAAEDALGVGAMLVPGHEIWGDVVLDPRRDEVVHASRPDLLRWRSVTGSGAVGEVGGVGAVEEIVIDPTSARLVALARDRVLVVDRDRGAITARLAGTGYEMTAAVSADGSRLALAPVDRPVVELWDLERLEPVDTVPTGPLPAYRVAFAPLGDRLCVLPRTGGCEIVEPSTGRRVVFDGGAGGMGAEVAWCADGERVAVGYEHGLVVVHDARTGRSVPLPGVERPISGLCWSGDGRALWAGDLQGLVLRWDADAAAPTWSLRPGSDVSGPYVAWSADSSAVVIGRAILGGLPHDATDGSPREPWGAHGAPGHFSRDLDFVARRVAGRLEVRDRRGDLVADPLEIPAETRCDLDWSPTADLLVALIGKDLRCLDARSGRWSPILGRPTAGSVAWSMDGGSLLCAEFSTLRRMQLAPEGALELSAWPQPDGITAVCSDPSGARIAVALASGPIRILDGAGGDEVARLTGLTGGAESLHWHPTAPRLVSCGGGGLRIWDVEHEHCVLHVDAWTGTARWSPDGLSLATVLLSGPAHVWRVAAARR